MKAVVITRPGGPAVLEIRDVPRPVPGASQVLVRVEASALNRADLLQREGHYPAPADSPKDIPGLELAGVVAECGANARRWREGDRVFGIIGGGAQAGYVVAHEDALAAIPANLSATDAGAVPEAFITAHDAMVTQAGVQRGDRVLVHAAGSGVGLAAIQLARAFGAEVFGTARTADKIERARALGLSAGCVVRDELDAMVSAVREWSGGHGADVVLDLVGGPYLAASTLAAAMKGRIILIGTMAGRETTLPLRAVLGNRLTIRGTMLRSRPLDEKVAATDAFVRDVVPLLASGVVKPVIDRVFRMDEIRAAHEHLASNATFGKVVIEIDS